MATNEPSVADSKKGLPLWVPLLGLLIAFGGALFIGARICPVLSAIILPPDPRLPAGTVKQLDHAKKGIGLDEFLYGTNLTGCQVALFYQDWLHDCTFDPDVSCGKGTQERSFVAPKEGYHVATCTGTQPIGIFNLKWTAYVSSGYPTGDKTVFRLVREVGN